MKRFTPLAWALVAFAIVCLVLVAMSGCGRGAKVPAPAPTVAIPRDAFGSAMVAAPQCAVVSGPTQFRPTSAPTNFRTGFNDSLGIVGGSRLIVRENYGYGIYSLSNPASPTHLAWNDMSRVIPQQGDGQSLTSMVGGGSDPVRALVGWKQSVTGTWLMRVSGVSGNGFTGGFTSATPTGGMLVASAGGGIWAFSLSVGGLYAADVTSLPTSGLTTMGSIAGAKVPGAPVNAYIKGLSVAGGVLAYEAGTVLVLVDVSTPPSWHVSTYTPAQLGLPADSKFTTASAALHPDGRVFILAESSYGRESAGVVLAAATAGGTGLSAIEAPFHPPAPYGVSGGSTTGAAAMVVQGGDVLALVWESLLDGSSAKLYTFSANAWGSDLTPGAAYDRTTYPRPYQIAAQLVGDTVYSYGAAGFGAYALGLRCGGAPPAPSPTATPIPAPIPGCLCGDVNGDGTVNMSDTIYLINYLSAGGPAPACK